MSTVSIRQASRGYSKSMRMVAEGGLFKLEERIAERYIVRECWGEGAVGFSYGVFDDVQKTQLCLKVIHPNLLQTAEEQKRFEIVLRQVSRLSHPNLGRVFEVGNAKGRMFYTQQWIEGMSLRRIIDERLLKGSLFSCKELEPILAQLIHALGVVHQTGAHLNLKPENIFVLPDLLKLTDVGLGHAIPRAPFVQAHRMRREESYFSPEFLSGMEADSGADVYSLGVIIGEMLAGILPEGGVASLKKSNADIPEELETIYRKAIAASPLVRYRSIAEFHSDFSSFYNKHMQGGRLLHAAQARGFSTSEISSDALTPRVSSANLASLELKDLLSKRTVRIIRWSAMALGALLVIGVLAFLMRSGPEELSGRHVEGFVQPAPVAPEAQKNTAPASKLPPAYHTEAIEEPEEEPPAAPNPPKPASPANPANANPPAPPKPNPPKPTEAQRAAPRATTPPAAEASRCPEQMVRIAAGSVKMGTEKDDAYLSFEDLPFGSKEVGGFCIDTYEYPNRSGQAPLVNVGWAEAQELCQKQGKRLCKEPEWEKACRGNSGLRWPYGNTFDEGACNSANSAGVARTLSVSGRFSRCTSPHGLLDMSGNVAEWTEEKTLKGGSFASPDFGVRCASRKLRASASSETGFRCCANLK